MRCPKCGGHMAAINRNGIAIEQCQMCKGVYLDNGEIEALKQREGFATVVQASMPTGNAPPPGPGIRCPKCAGLMRHYNRSGVGVEQCDACRGMFLDHGELESLKANESPYNRPGWGAPGAPPQANPYPHHNPAPYPQYNYGPSYGHNYGHPYGYGYGYYGRRPKTVFEMLVST